MNEYNLDPETFLIVDKVLKQLVSKHTFDSYEADDMYQEGYLIACKAIKAYDPSKGTTLSTFLYGHLSKRLKNFIRDHSVRVKNHCIKHTEYVDTCKGCERRQLTQDKKRDVQRPKSLGGMEFSAAHTEFSAIEVRDIETKINRHLPKDMREDYLRMKDESYVPRTRRTEVESKILEILSE